MSDNLLGRQVVYSSIAEGYVYDLQEYTATVTKDHGENEVDLVVFMTDGLLFKHFIGYSPVPMPGMWSWPEFKRPALQEVGT